MPPVSRFDGLSAYNFVFTVSTVIKRARSDPMVQRDFRGLLVQRGTF